MSRPLSEIIAEAKKYHPKDASTKPRLTLADATPNNPSLKDNVTKLANPKPGTSVSNNPTQAGLVLGAVATAKESIGGANPIRAGATGALTAVGLGGVATAANSITNFAGGLAPNSRPWQGFVNYGPLGALYYTFN